VPPSHDGDNVTNHRTGGRCDDTYALRERWQWTFSRGIKEPFSKQASLELFKRKLKRPGAARLHRLGDQLKLAAALVDGDASAYQHGEAIGGPEAQQASLPAKEDDGQLSVAVFESEVDMAGGRRTAVGDLALNPKVGVVSLDVLTDVGDQRANAPNAALECDRRTQGWLKLGLFGGERRFLANYGRFD
jgi:hypothetical protein